ncbi:hypothetical protein CAPTEDRAFT_210209 [Capitella teleta]|uniref:Uncharacterized protein n=1 Tax=Capitella teleta TaxID=283909 RepID=R7TA45_CAPTE|nr:hypothetical protein CAPTEDRAFT_189494 [Capitella teleta]ELT90347.1 hypothetical protein CAPTEDRAFT_210209 [Capitella teleta]|eukprot:ELT87721.1 hypothetical protein CAPTEDRAFT_189494 [Capitella teleta]
MHRDKHKPAKLAPNARARNMREVDRLIDRFRTLRTIYNECARAIEVHCQQITFWSEKVVPGMSDDAVSCETSLDKESLAPSAVGRKHLLFVLNELKSLLSDYYKQLIVVKKAFDELYYSKDRDSEKLRMAFASVEDDLIRLRGVRFVPCDSLLWQPTEGTLGKLEEFHVTVFDCLEHPKVVECPPHNSIRSPVNIIKNIFKRPLSVFGGNKEDRSLRKTQSVPRLHQF